MKVISPRNPAPRPVSQTECRYYKNKGHTIEQCRKRIYNNNYKSREEFLNPRQEMLNSSQQNPAPRRTLRSLQAAKIRVAPSIILLGPEFRQNEALMMIDTGAELSIIKQASIPPEIPIYTDVVYDLNGITQGHLATIGYIKAKIVNMVAKIHVVQNLPIAQDGILGTDFF